MLSTNVNITSFRSERLKQLFGYIVAPQQWHVPTREELGRLFTKALEGCHTGLVTMMEAVASMFQYQDDGLQVTPGAYPQADVQHINDEHEHVRDVASNITDSESFKSTPVEVRLTNRGRRGFIPRPLQLGSIHNSTLVGIHGRPLSFQSSFGIESARKSLEEKKKQRNSTGSVGMGEWLRARCSYNGGKYDTVVTPTIPQELLTEQIGVAC